MKCVFTKPPVPKPAPKREKPKREAAKELPTFKIKAKEVKDESK